MRFSAWCLQRSIGGGFEAVIGTARHTFVSPTGERLRWFVNAALAAGAKSTKRVPIPDDAILAADADTLLPVDYVQVSMLNNIVHCSLSKESPDVLKFNQLCTWSVEYVASCLVDFLPGFASHLDCEACPTFLIETHCVEPLLHDVQIA